MYATEMPLEYDGKRTWKKKLVIALGAEHYLKVHDYNANNLLFYCELCHAWFHPEE